MLADPRSAALVDNFAGQWLYAAERPARGAGSVNVFPDFDENLREAIQRETELFLESQLREDRSVVELLTRELHLRQRAAGAALRHPERLRQPLPARDAGRRSARGGLLGQGSILTVTSYAEPHVAGAARQVAAREHPRHAAAAAAAQRAGAAGERREGQADVGARADGDSTARTRPAPSCHAQMDPLGFALENFDAIGRWRTADEAARRSTPRRAARRHDVRRARPGCGSCCSASASSSSRR